MIDRAMMIFLAAACLLLAVLLYRHEHAPTPATRWPGVADSDGDSPGLHELLDAKIPLIDFKNVPARQAFVELGRLGRANILVRWEALRLAHLKAEAPLTLVLKDVTLRQALGIVMIEAEHDADERLGFAVNNGIIIISTYGDFDPKPITMAYNVRDLIARLKETGMGTEMAIATISSQIERPGENERIGPVGDVAGILIVRANASRQAEVEEILARLRGPDGMKILNPDAEQAPTSRPETFESFGPDIPSDFSHRSK